MSAAKPMDPPDRLYAYIGDRYGHSERASLTARQRRRIAHKANRAAGTRELTPRQSRWAGIRAIRAARRAGAEL